MVEYDQTNPRHVAARMDAIRDIRCLFASIGVTDLSDETLEKSFTVQTHRVEWAKQFRDSGELTVENIASFFEEAKEEAEKSKSIWNFPNLQRNT